MPDFAEMLDELLEQNWGQYSSSDNYRREIQRAVAKRSLHHLLQLANHSGASSQARAIAVMKIMELQEDLNKRLESTNDSYTKAHLTYGLFQIEQFLDDPAEWKAPSAPSLPDGSPIGCGGFFE